MSFVEQARHVAHFRVDHPVNFTRAESRPYGHLLKSLLITVSITDYCFLDPFWTPKRHHYPCVKPHETL